MRIFLVILAFPAIFFLLITVILARWTRDRYLRQEIDKATVIRQLGLASALWGSLVLLGGVMMSSFGLGSRSLVNVIFVALLVTAVAFATLSKGVLWGRA